MRKKEQKELSVRVNISLPPETLQAIDGNVDKLQKWLIRQGADEKEVTKLVSRSSLIKEVVKLLGEEAGFFALRGGFAALLGFADNQQLELFPG